MREIISAARCNGRIFAADSLPDTHSVNLALDDYVELGFRYGVEVEGMNFSGVHFRFDSFARRCRIIFNGHSQTRQVSAAGRNNEARCRHEICVMNAVLRRRPFSDVAAMKMLERFERQVTAGIFRQSLKLFFSRQNIRVDKNLVLVHLLSGNSVLKNFRNTDGNTLFSQLMQQNKDEGSSQPVINVDFSQYVSKGEFEKHKKENDQEFKKIWDEIEKLKELINKIFGILDKKADLSDLEDLKNFLLGKLDELAFACNKKFADKNETTNNFRYLEDQFKKILEMLAKKDSQNEADNWLLAKKPMGGYSCAACESYIGDLRDDAHKFIPWNKMPLRDPGDKLYRMGNGFSKMLQMLNFDNNGNISLNPNIMNENTLNSNENVTRIASAMPGQIPSNNLNNNSGSKVPLKKRIQSANPKIKMNTLKENKLKSQHSKDGTIEVSKTKNDLFPDIYENSGGKGDDQPKITKVIRKKI